MAQALADQLQKALWRFHQPICLAILRALTAGQPVSPNQVAEVLHISGDEVRDALKTFQDIEYDRAGNVVAAGLSLIPAPHRIWFNNHALFAWCALDTLMYPVLLQQSARVESSCLITSLPIRLTVTPTQVLHLEPAQAVVSMVVPPCCSEESGNTRGTFCNLVHFFSSAEVGGAWRKSHPEGEILSVAEAYQLGQMLAQHRLNSRLT